MNEIFIGSFWVAYYILHSALASNAINRYFKNLFPHIYPHYRALYSMIAIVNFILLFGLHVRVASPMLIERGPALTVVASLMGIAGVLAIVLASRSYRWSFFWRSAAPGAAPQGLITTGMNAHVRHPLYFGTLLLIVALVCVSPNAKNLVFAAVSIAYIFIGAKLEERKLREEYGAQYSAYAARVKMIIPYLF